MIKILYKNLTKSTNKCKLILETFAHMQMIKQKIKLISYTIKRYALKIAFEKNYKVLHFTVTRFYIIFY